MVGRRLFVRGVPVVLAAMVLGIIGGIVAAEYQASDAEPAYASLESTSSADACAAVEPHAPADAPMPAEAEAEDPRAPCGSRV